MSKMPGYGVYMVPRKQEVFLQPLSNYPVDAESVPGVGGMQLAASSPRTHTAAQPLGLIGSVSSVGRRWIPTSTY